MTYYINPHTFDQRMLQWKFNWPASGPPSNFRSQIGREHGSNPSFTARIPMRQTTKHKAVPDICTGGRGSRMMVSQKVRDLIADLDPVEHHYVPFSLTLADGRISEDEYFLFQSGDLIDGIDPDKSEVDPVIIDGKFSHYSAPSRPVVLWRADAIKGRHIWVDRHLSFDVFISDEFFSLLKAEKVGAFYHQHTP